jgi:hypothetical protein
MRDMRNNPENCEQSKAINHKRSRIAGSPLKYQYMMDYTKDTLEVKTTSQNSTKYCALQKFVVHF